MKVIRYALALVVTCLGFGGCAAACTKDETATSGCKGSVSQHACKTCCGMKGSSITSYWPGSGCTCYKK